MKWIRLFFKQDLSDKTIKGLWSLVLQRIDKKAREFSRNLNPPASLADIQRVEKKMDLVLPDQLKELYLCNNGEGDKSIGTFYGLGFMSIEKMYSEWTFFRESLEKFDINTINNLNKNCSSTPVGAVKQLAINTRWIPIAQDWGGNFLAVDIDPDIKGCVGQIINIGRDEDDKFVIANSLKEYLILLISHLDKYKFYMEKSDDEICFSSKVTTHTLDFYDDIFRKQKASL